MTLLAKSFSKISADDEIDFIGKLLVAKQNFFDLHEDFNNVLLESRTTQTAEERVLQAQFISRVAFVSSQIKDLDYATFRRILEHGIRVGEPAAECLATADASLKQLADEIGSMVMQISAIARKDFNRIPTEFVHPLIEENERLSQNFLNIVMTEVASRNVIFDFTETVNSLESQLEQSRNLLPIIRDDFQTDFDIKRRQMNYVKAEIFPLLEHALIYFQEDADEIIVDLEACA